MTTLTMDTLKKITKTKSFAETKDFVKEECSSFLCVKVAEREGNEFFKEAKRLGGAGLVADLTLICQALENQIKEGETGELEKLMLAYVRGFSGVGLNAENPFEFEDFLPKFFGSEDEYEKQIKLAAKRLLA